MSVMSLSCESLLERIEKLSLRDAGALIHGDHAIDDGIRVAVGAEVLEARLNGFDARAQDEIGIDGDLETHLRQSSRGHYRSAAALDHVGDLHAGQAADLGQRATRPWRLGEQGVRAGVVVSPRASEGLVQALNGDGVRSRDDYQFVLPAGLDRRPDLLHGLAEGYELLAFEVPALLGDHLILNLNRRRTGAYEFLHRAVQVHGVAVAGVNVANDRNLHCAGHFPDLIQHLAHRDQAHVGQRELTVRDAGAGRVDDRKSRELDEAGCQAVIGAGCNQERVACEQLSEISGVRHHVTFRLSVARDVGWSPPRADWFTASAAIDASRMAVRKSPG